MGSQGIDLEISLPPDFLKLNDSWVSPVKCKFTSRDFGLTWEQFFQKQEDHVDLFEAILANKDGYMIWDRRPLNARESWNLDNKLKQFVESFNRNMQSQGYKAALGGVPLQRSGRGRPKSGVKVSINPESVRITGPAQINARMNAGPSTSARILKPPTSSSARKQKATGNIGPQSGTKRSKVGNPSELHLGSRNGVDASRPNRSVFRRTHSRDPVHVEMDAASVDNDDAVSIADSQDSQLEFLKTRNIDNRDVKAKFLTCIEKQLDNTKLLLIREELRKLYIDGAYCRITNRLPQTTFLLELIRQELH